MVKYRVAVMVGYQFDESNPGEVYYEYEYHNFDTQKKAIRFSERSRKHSKLKEVIPEHRTYITEIPEGLPF